jgi:hypothetical protein
MKKTLSLIVVGVIACASSFAQCDLNPAIKPDNLILCPNASDSLRTAKDYDSYQWFKNNKPIAGATSRYLKVDQYNDAGSYFKVAVTKNGCADTSKRVLVDGYVFLLPYVITTGDPGIYDPYKDVTFQCLGDKVILTMGDPFNTNIQWYNNYKPIEGATSKKFTLTEKGSYTVCGSPAICPSFTDCESVPLNYTFEKVDAAITERNDTLFASKAKNYRWYYNGHLIPGAKESYIVPDRNGGYALGINTTHNCTGLSEIYNYNNAKSIISVSPNPVNDYMHVRINKTGASKIIISDLNGNRFKQISVNSNNEFINVGDLHTGTYMLQLLDNKQQLITAIKIFKQ